MLRMRKRTSVALCVVWYIRLFSSIGQLGLGSPQVYDMAVYGGVSDAIQLVKWSHSHDILSSGCPGKPVGAVCCADPLIHGI